ncbi:MAG: hypothetical protein ACLGI3_20260 [Actinomycetes bacterium]
MSTAAPAPAGLLARFGLVAGLAFTILALAWTAVPPVPAQAADLREFSAGNIITDQVFFDEGSMSAGAVQAFLDEKGASCSRGADGTACLRAYRVDTFSRAATTYCPGGYQGAAQETGAAIIHKVAQACRVNPQVLMVMLQKEMGLIRTTNPTAKMYARAMGYGCPDNSTGTCDSAYYGLYNQLYSAASQFNRYVMNPTKYAYRAGVTNSILLHPYNDCGRQSVYIENGATAALYNYTPYVPNQAALDAGYGTGNSCSSYGNRNFFSYFTDWFGSTQSTGSGAINLKYTALGGASSPPGSPVAATQCGLAAGGCGRAYQHGSIYWSPSSGAAMVQGEVLTGWWSVGGADGWLGYPVADWTAVPGGKAGAFQGGSLYWSPATGAAAVSKELLGNWWSTGGIEGHLGYPVASTGTVPGGKASAFQGGSIYWSATTGAHWLAGEVRSRYWALGSINGELGFPTSDLAPASTGQAAAFQGGSIYWSAATGAAAVHKELLPNWWSTGGVSGRLGWPIANSGAVEGGKAGAFQGGSIYWSAGTGGHWMAGEVRNEYWARGGTSGVLGFPTSDLAPAGTGQAAAFEGGSIYWSAASGAAAVHKELLPAWWRTGGVDGHLGWPLAATRSVPGGKASSFQGGTIYWSAATGARWLAGEVRNRYERADAASAALGFPIADQGAVTGGQAAAFQAGSIYWSAGTGAHVVRGEVRSAWWARGGITGPLGYPTADTAATPGLDGVSGQVGRFAGGALLWSRATEGRVLSGAVLAEFDASGGAEVLGFPVADQGAVTGGQAAALQAGSIYWSSGTGAHVVRGSALSAYWAAGSVTGQLGFPTAGTSPLTAGGLRGDVTGFQGGSIFATATTGAKVVRSAVDSQYRAAGGPASTYGWPTSDTYDVPGGVRNDFQSGQMTG